ncbi:hypothetical protein WNY79_03010 [Pseudoalteromonas sp. AS84]|uniref:hypothetical protein n=1 Tax=Pseudoalteromonas sp. AS84 TaxID=3135778 RepID=UPI00316EB3C5
MEKKALFYFLVAISLVGCNNVPEHGAMLNEKVSEGISKNQVEVEGIINALADVERAILDQKWDEIYGKVESKYILKHSVAAAASLTQPQRRAIAANASQTYFNLLDKISEKEQELISATRANSNTIKSINNEVTQYLLSVEELEAAKSNITSKLSELTGYNLSSISGLASNLIGGI